MVKNWEEKLEPGFYLRVKKIGNNYFAYARSQGSFRPEERYLGRCDKDGNIVSKRRKIRRNKN